MCGRLQTLILPNSVYIYCCEKCCDKKHAQGDIRPTDFRKEKLIKIDNSCFDQCLVTNSYFDIFRILKYKMSY